MFSKMASKNQLTKLFHNFQTHHYENMFYVYLNTKLLLQVLSYPLVSTLIIISVGILVIERKLRKLPMDEFTLTQRIRNYKPRPLVEADETDFKELPIKESKYNFAEVDYLCFGKDKNLINEVANCIRHYGVGTCGPRHFYGSTDVHYALEEGLAKFLNVQDAIVYSYSYSTIASSVACYCQVDDVVFIDDLCNPAIVMGMASRKCTNIYFKHNDPDDFLKSVTKHSDAKKILILEGIYAKDGSICSLKEFIEIAKKFKVRIFVDESISFGTLGKTGRGITEHYDVNINEIDMIIGSLEHALHSNGGFCAGSSSVIEHQRLCSASYVYSASLQTFSAKAALIALENIGNKALVLRLVSLKVDQLLRKIKKLIVRSHPESPLKVFYPNQPTRRLVLANKLNDFLVMHGVYVLVEDENLKMNLHVGFGKNPGDFDELHRLLMMGVEKCF